DALPERFRTLRARARLDGHTRQPQQVAHLYLGLETWLRFAVEIGAITDVKADSLLADTWTALMALAAEHARDHADETPVQRFLGPLGGGFASRRIYLTAPHGDVPEHATAWGWEISRRADGSGEGEFRHAPQAILIGMLEADWVWLIPDTTYGL